LSFYILRDIYAAGDVASFYNFALHQMMRVEHEDNALSMGKVAGQNMAGRETAYQHQPFFYSDLFDLGFEAVGDLNAHIDTFADWKEPFRKGVVYYLKERKIRGVLLWNTWDQVEAARELISHGNNYTDSELTGLLPRP
jgi:3-phenylpropionate/trans-cinnamate dioxygenase ferredoxin reductase component